MEQNVEYEYNPYRWHYRFLDIAKLVASWSKDPSTKCGAVIARSDKTIASVGYNGFARGCDDAPHLYEDRALKYERVIHAEMNAILNAKEPLDDYTIYTYPSSVTGACNRCAAHIIQTGIKRIVFNYEDSENVSRRNGDPVISLSMYKEAGVEVISVERN